MLSYMKCNYIWNIALMATVHDVEIKEFRIILQVGFSECLCGQVYCLSLQPLKMSSNCAAKIKSVAIYLLGS